MNTGTQHFEISEIALLTFADEITMRGTIHKSNLSYETELSISSSQLNRVINALQVQNPELDVADTLLDQSNGYGNSLCFLSVDQLENRMIDFDSFTELKEIKRIRA